MTYIRGLLICALMCCCVSTVAAARNAPGQQWAVGPIQTQAKNGAGYCSMKSSYPSGHTLVFARDAKGSNSIAVDFGTQDLSVGGQYKITLSIGILSRQMIAVAATAHVMIVQMGTDEAFYDMLGQRDILQLTFQKEKLTFGLEGVSEGLRVLSDCVTAQKSGKTFAKKSVALAPPPVTSPPMLPKQQSKATRNAAKVESIGLQALTTSLRDEMERLRAENRQLLLENQNIAGRMARADLRDDRQDIAMQSEFERRQQMLQAENAKLLTALSSNAKDIQSTAELRSEFERRARAMQEENFRLKEMLEEQAQNDQEDIALKREIVSRMSAVEQENLRLRHELAKLFDELKAPATAPAPAPVLTRPAPVKESRAPVLTKPRVAAVAAAQTRAIPAARARAMPVAKPRYAGGGDLLTDIVKLSAYGGVQPSQDSASGSYRWQSGGGVFSAAKELPVSSSQDVHYAAETYLSRLGTRCQGDFAHKLKPSRQVGLYDLVAGEMACIDDINDAAAAFLFVRSRGKTVVLTHEGSTDQIADAISLRDYAMSSIGAL